MSGFNIALHDASVAQPSGHANPDNVSSSPGPVPAYGGHLHPRRLFVGPMPAEIAVPSAAKKEVQGQRKHWWSIGGHDGNDDQHDDDESGDEDVVPDGHAFRYFLQLGGREEEWGVEENLRKRTKREMLRRWRQSSWSLTSNHHKARHHHKKWIGQTFQIGIDFLGVPMPASDLGSPKSPEIPSAVYSTPHETSSKLFSAKSFHTAPEHHPESIGEDSSANEHNYAGSKHANGSGIALLPNGEGSSHDARTYSSTGPSSSSKVMADRPNRRPSGHSGDDAVGQMYSSATGSRTARHSAFHRLSSAESKGKAVQFSPFTRQHEQPAPPPEVLSRRPSGNPETSHSAMAAQVQEVQDNVKFGDVFLHDRMLVRRFRVASESAKTYFDAEEAMKTRYLRTYAWKELLVVWRKDQLELYEDYSIPGKEMILGHKCLAFIIPLQKPDTLLSLYSFTDLTFCLTCTTLRETKNKSRTTSGFGAKVLRQGSGTEIFVFKCKTRSRSVDWMWNIWRWLGNDIPLSFDVYSPATENCVRVPVPDYDASGSEGYKIFTRDHVVALCQTALRGTPSWDYLIGGSLSGGVRLELCWRKESMLDWVRWETDSDGKRRDWAVLYGMALKKPHEIVHLEVRVGEHRPTSVIFSDGKHFQEPPAIEGYLHRIKPSSQTRVHVYVAVHNGCLFLINPYNVQPPEPPVPIEGATKNDESSLPFWDRETQRGAEQVLHADVFIDLRNVAAVRRAFQVIAPSQQSSIPDDDESHPREEVDIVPTTEDHADEGGDEVLSGRADGHTVKMRRSFELLMKTGTVVRFEAHSCKVGLEWMTYLTRLVKYWKLRHRIDAREEMDLTHHVNGLEKPILLNPEKVVIPKAFQDYSQPSEYLPRFWNWCVLDGCLPVVKSGRLYLRRGFRGQYTLMELVLVASGHLVQFHIMHGTAQHRRAKTTSLVDAYVCSGYFAVQALPKEEFSASGEPIPRRFQDGLETDDAELDKILVIWYRAHSSRGAVNEQGAHDKTSPERAALPLSMKRKVLVLKARSKLERNAWSWALNAEIERMSRRNADGITKRT